MPPDPRRHELDELLGAKFTREDVAANLHISDRTLRRILQTIVGLVPIKAGRKMLLTANDVKLIEAAIRCPYISQGNAKKGGPWYARGTVRVGKTKVSVAEFSTGQSARTAALDAAAAEESRIRAEIIDGPAVRAAELTIADAILAYASRAGGIHALDALRLANFNDLIGHWPLNSADGAWSAWIERRASGLAPATVARSRAILRAALAYGAAHHRVATPVIAKVALPRGANDRIAYLTHEEADRLVAAYNEAARPVALVLRYQGLRTQEALRLDWRAIDWRRQTIFVTATDQIGTARTKSARSRTIAMHRRVRVTLYLLWGRKGRPSLGPVFISTRGKPYADTRGRGGNPLARAHITACSKAAIR